MSASTSLDQVTTGHARAPSSARAPGVAPLAWILVAYTALFGAYVLGAPSLPVERKLIVDLGQMVAPLLAAALCWSAARGSSRSWERLSWTFLTVGALAWVCGQAAWSYYELALGKNVPTNTPADLLWGLYYILVFCGLMLQVQRGEGFYARLTSTFDALLLTLAAAGLIWQFLLAPATASYPRMLDAASIFAWPLGDLLVVFALVTLALRWPLEKVPASAILLFAAFAVQLATDTIYTSLVMGESYYTGHPVDSLWQLVYALMGLAATAHLREPRRHPETGHWRSTLNLGWTRGARILLPYFALPVAFLLLYINLQPSGGMAALSPRINMGIALALIVLVMVRQSLMLLENHKLSVILTALSQELEARVVHRTQELTYRTEELTHKTAELAALNEVATRLSHCPTSEEVLESGIDMACEATGLSAGAVWLMRTNGRAELVAHRGVSNGAVPLLADLVRIATPLRETLKSGRPVVLRRADLLSYRPQANLVSHVPERLVAVPLMSRGTVFGILGLLRTEEGIHDGSELQLAVAIGAQLGVALESSRRYEEAKYLADRDPVTGLLNHRAIHEALEQELRRSLRSGHGFSLLMMDLDGFKLFNDTYGHPVGDQILRQVALTMGESARTTDVLARYGGDEFMILLPDTDADGAVALAERLRASLMASPYVALDGVSVPIRLSCGVATYPENGRLSHDLVGFADTNLYLSKQQGGDTITAGAGFERPEVARSGTFSVLDGLITAIDNKDHYTRHHSEDVTRYAMALARALGVSEESQRTLRIAALLHDVGKIGVPDSILRKPGRLEEDEISVLRQHALLGEMIIKDVPNAVDVIMAVGAHHERYDGQGYPRGLRGAEIPLLGRVLAVADAYSAMTSDRPYRKAMTRAQARSELMRAAGSHLDFDLVRVFLRIRFAEDTLEGAGLSNAS